MKNQTRFFTLFFLVFSLDIAAFSLPPDPLPDLYNKSFVYHAKRMEGSIKIDGELNEPDWRSAQKASDFYLVLPVDTGKAKQVSEVMLTFNDNAFYMAVVFYDTVPGKRIAESFRRDFVFNNNDNFLSFFDTFLDQTNGFSFGVNAAGAVWDGMMYDGATMNLDWDVKWESKTRHYADRWITEMRIPFKSVRYPANSRQWLVNFSRLDMKTNEKSSWAPVPRQFPTASLAYTGILEFDQPLPRQKPGVSFIPYLYAGYSDNPESSSGAVFRKDAGFDAKLGLSSSMNLDLTCNPDFAQVEVDKQQMNIDRFELFYPEKRQFFLENRDLFAGFGFGNLTPFFSRRIGLDAPVMAGARITGKIGNDIRIGLINMTTQKSANFAARNYTVASVQKKILRRSNLGFIFVNKEYLRNSGEDDHFNRIAGLDLNFAGSSNIWTGKLFYHRSFQPSNPSGQFAQGASVVYKRRKSNISLTQASVGENFRAETGFVQRTGYHYLNPYLSYLFVPNHRVISHGPFADFKKYQDVNFSDLEYELRIGYNMELSNRATLSAGLSNNAVKLLADFDPTHVSDVFLPRGNEYRFSYFFGTFTSDNRKPVQGTMTASSGEFYNGHMNSVEGILSYRFQPYLSLKMGFTFSDLLLPEPFTRKQLWLIAPNLDLTLTGKLFFSTFVQYNEQIDNLNLNMRFQWRYQPVSDFFVVYTDNYMPGTWNHRNRALVLKLSYWLN